MKRKLLSTFLAFVMALSLLPTAALATDTDDSTGTGGVIEAGTAGTLGAFTISNDDTVFDGAGKVLKNGALTVTGNNVTVKNLTFGDGASLKVNTAGSFTLTGCTFNGTTYVRTPVSLNVGSATVTGNTFDGTQSDGTPSYYNAIEFAVSSGNKLSSATLSNNTFEAAIKNNYFSTYYYTDNATITVENNIIKLANRGSNAIRISNVTNSDVTFNLNNNSYAFSDSSGSSEWEGFILLQDFSKDTAVQDFSKITIDIDDLTTPSDATRLFYVYDDQDGIISTNQPKITGDGSIEKFFAAKVGTTMYSSLDAAIAAANGETITLLKDLTIDQSIKVTANAVIDGDGHTITLKYTGATSAENCANAIFNDYGGNEGIVKSLTVKDLNMVMANTTKNGYAFVAGKGDAEGFAISFTGCSFKNMWCGAMLNGCRNTVAPSVTIKDCTFENVSYGVSFAETSYAGTVTFSGNRMKGENAIQEIFTNQAFITSPTVKISDGFYSADPTAYCAEGKTGVANTDAKTKADYPFTVGTVETEVKVAPATTEAEATVPDGATPAEKTAIESAATSVSNTTVSGLDAAAGSEATEIKESAVTAATAKLIEDGVNVDGATVTVYVQPYLDIKVTDAKVADGGSTPTTITLDIKPMVKEIASTATSASDIVTKADATDGSGKTQNAVQVGEAKELTVTTPVTLTVPLPNGFVSSTADIYVKHSKEDGASYIYTATVTNSGGTYYATFTNPNGFSTFDFTTENPAVAQIGTQNYPTLQAAVDAVKNGETIKLLKSDGTATVNRTVKFTVDRNGENTYTINLGSYCTDKDEGADVYDVVYDRPSSGSSKYSISLPETMTHGSAKLSKASASKGDKVTLTVTPDKGYTLEILNATDAKGNEVELTAVELGKEYTFKMPASAVTLEVTFMEDNTMLNYFVDVNAGDYFYDSVLWAAENGITKGVDDLHFDPNGLCTRAQIVTFLWRASGSPEAKAESSFSDVAAGSYYAEAVAWAVANGVTNGTGNGAFSPDATCTRAQAVTFLARALNAKAESRAAFGDVPETAYYADAVAWAAESGVTTGVGAGRFAPDDDCTRAQIVTFLWRAMVK